MTKLAITQKLTVAQKQFVLDVLAEVLSEKYDADITLELDTRDDEYETE